MPPRTPSDVFTPPYNPHDAFRSDQEWARRDGAKPGRASQGSRQFSDVSPLGAPSRGPWWMFGFQKKSTIGLFIFFGGAILGFSLSRTMLMHFNTLLKITTPGEGYWYEKAVGKANIIIHIFTSLPASFFSVFCFLPITYNRWPRFHGVLGYIVSVLLAISCVCGGVLGRRSQGGDLNMQAAVYILASATAYAVVIGCLEARRGALDTHREYMLRAWFYNGAFVTTRVTALLSAQVITVINTYYSLWQCAEIAYVLKTPGALAQAYPMCATPDALAHPNDVVVSVHASWNEGRLHKGSATRASFGMALWVAMLLHMVGIEIYIRMTAGESKRLRELSEQKIAARDHMMSR